MNEIEESVPLQIVFIDGLPRQLILWVDIYLAWTYLTHLNLLYFLPFLHLFSSDCGAYLRAFAEYFSANRIKLCNEYFDIKLYRQPVTCLHYHYRRIKAANNLESDAEELVVKGAKTKGKKSSKKSSNWFIAIWYLSEIGFDELNLYELNWNWFWNCLFLW